MSVGHYLGNLKALSKGWDLNKQPDEMKQRLYMKDIDCPPAWQEALKSCIPPGLFYLNDGIAIASADADEDLGHNATEESNRVSPSGDLMACLPESMRAENMMCYIGHEGTYTPAHMDMCASLGQNIMVEASGSQSSDETETLGSSIWFMTESNDRDVVAEYWSSVLGHDIEVESHFASLDAWRKAPFTTYVVEQKVGDLILVPPMAPHQLWNLGTRTMKVAWSRTTVETLELALHEALPRSRMVCRSEEYKCKAMIYFSLKKYVMLLLGIEDLNTYEIKRHRGFIQLKSDVVALYHLFTEIMLS